MIPSEYYNGNLLATANIITPCTIDTTTLCRLYQYPDVASFSVVRGINVYRPVYDEANEGEVEALEYMTDFQVRSVRCSNRFSAQKSGVS